MVANTDPLRGLDMPLSHFPEGSNVLVGQSRTLHSAKGREFDAVIMYGVNASDIPNDRDKRLRAIHGRPADCFMSA
jgi:DNA helicase-2/ATP-dependent DNA helicase PcrA